MQGRCSGCDYEGPVRRVESHQRSCEGFAELYRSDPALALVTPVDVYAAAHVVVPASASVLPSDPLVEAGTEVVVRSRRARKAKPEVEPPSRAPGSVYVEYWDWQPTMLEELQDVQAVI